MVAFMRLHPPTFDSAEDDPFGNGQGKMQYEPPKKKGLF